MTLLYCNTIKPEVIQAKIMTSDLIFLEITVNTKIYFKVFRLQMPSVLLMISGGVGYEFLGCGR